MIDSMQTDSTTNPYPNIKLCSSNLLNYYSTGTCLITWVLLPGICGVGFFLNCLAIGIFSLAIHRGHRTPMTVYLITLSMFDSIQLLLSIFIITFAGSYFLIGPNGDHSTLVSQQTLNAIDWIRTYATVYAYPLLMAANYGSIWVVTLICVQRYFAICYPLTSLRTVELRRAVNEVLLISAAAAALNFCRFWEFRLEHFVDPTSNQTYPMINFGPFRNETAHPYYLLAMDGVLYTVLLYALPFTIVSILNVRIVMAIYRARILNQFIGESSRNRREHRSALMVLAIILLFFICYTLAVAERIWSILDEDGANSEFGEFLNAVSNLMYYTEAFLCDGFQVNLNSTIDPLIYFLFSRGFKDLFMKMRKKKYSDMTSGLLQSQSASLVIRKNTSEYLSASNGQHPTLDSTMRPLLAAASKEHNHPSRVGSVKCYNHRNIVNDNQSSKPSQAPEYETPKIFREGRVCSSSNQKRHQNDLYVSGSFSNYVDTKPSVGTNQIQQQLRYFGDSNPLGTSGSTFNSNNRSSICQSHSAQPIATIINRSDHDLCSNHSITTRLINKDCGGVKNYGGTIAYGGSTKDFECPSTTLHYINPTAALIVSHLGSGSGGSSDGGSLSNASSTAHLLIPVSSNNNNSNNGTNRSIVNVNHVGASSTTSLQQRHLPDIIVEYKPPPKRKPPKNYNQQSSMATKMTVQNLL